MEILSCPELTPSVQVSNIEAWQPRPPRSREVSPGEPGEASTLRRPVAPLSGVQVALATSQVQVQELTARVAALEAERETLEADVREEMRAEV